MDWQPMLLEVTELTYPSKDNLPYQLKGVTEEGTNINVTVWGDNPHLPAFIKDRAAFPMGYEITVQCKSGGQYGDVWNLSKLKTAVPKPVMGGANGSQSPTELPQELKRPIPASAPPVQQNTPQAVMAGSANTKDRSITVLAVMKSVIESGGSEEDFRTWLGLHDEIVHGKNRG